MALVKRITKGSPLTAQEMDDNLDYLQSQIQAGTSGTAGSSGVSGTSGSSGTAGSGGSRYWVGIIATVEVQSSTLGLSARRRGKHNLALLYH